MWLNPLRSLSVACRLPALVLAIQKYWGLCEAVKAAVAATTAAAGESATALAEASRKSAITIRLVQQAAQLVIEDSRAGGEVSKSAHLQAECAR